MNHRIRIASALLSAVALFGACDDSEDRQDNPHYSTGGNQPTGGGSNEAGASPAAGEFAGGSASQAAGGNAQGGDAQAGDGQAGMTNGAAGAPAEPPYDCVLTPKTHLDIINACTDAVRIEKHPELPPIE